MDTNVMDTNPMDITHWTPLMHVVLDGEGTPEEEAALKAYVAADPAARDEFAQLEGLFARLAAVPSQYPPEGLVAAVDARVGPYVNITQDTAVHGSQLFGGARVLDSNAPDTDLDAGSNFSSRFYFGKNAMTKTNSLFANRKVLVGGGIAIAAAAIGFALGLGSPPDASQVAGTIVPAERFRAPQASTDDIQLADMSVAQLLQNDAFLKVVKDPQVQALMLDPAAEPAFRLLAEQPEVVRKGLAGDPSAQTETGFRASLARPELRSADGFATALAHPKASEILLDNPAASKAMRANMSASMSFIPAEMRASAAQTNATAASMTASGVASNSASNAVANGTAASMTAAGVASNSASNAAVNGHVASMTAAGMANNNASNAAANGQAASLTAAGVASNNASNAAANGHVASMTAAGVASNNASNAAANHVSSLNAASMANNHVSSAVSNNAAASATAAGVASNVSNNVSNSKTN